MKKILSIALVLLLALQGLALAAMAETGDPILSPGGTEYYRVIINHTNTGKNVTNTVVIPVGDSVEVTSLKSELGLDYQGFKLFVLNEKNELVVGKLGVDYEITKIAFADAPSVEATSLADLSVKSKVSFAISRLNTRGQAALMAKAEPVEGVDYEIRNGDVISLNHKLLSITVKPLRTDVYITENYKGVKIRFNTDAGIISPKTGVSMNMVAISLMLIAVVTALAGMCAFASRKCVKN